MELFWYSFKIHFSTLYSNENFQQDAATKDIVNGLCLTQRTTIIVINKEQRHYSQI